MFTRNCEYCKKEFSQKKGKYLKKYCSKECRYKHHGEMIAAIESSRSKEFYKERFEKGVNTCIEKYGRTTLVNPEKLSETLQSKDQKYRDMKETKARLTRLRRYGDANYRNYKKSQATKLEKYGDKNYNNPEKTKKTKIEKYGVCYANSEKANQTKIEKYGSLGILAQRAFETYKKGSGKNHPSHRNIKNYENYNLDFIKEHFIYENFVDIKGFGEYFNIKNSAAWLRKHFKITTQKRISNSEKEFLKHIGEGCDTQKKIFAYFVDGFKDGVVYEFLGDFWHGNPNKYNSGDINPVCRDTFGNLYKNTFKRFDEILKHPDVKEIRYIWESDFEKNNFLDFIKVYK